MPRDLTEETARIEAELFSEDLRKRLKPLVWEDLKFSRTAVAITELGTYMIEWNRTGDVRCGFAARSGSVPCDSIEHGKQLAEADYRHRVAGLFEE